MILCMSAVKTQQMHMLVWRVFSGYIFDKYHFLMRRFIWSLFYSANTNIVGAQKNCLKEMVPMSTHNSLVKTDKSFSSKFWLKQNSIYMKSLLNPLLHRLFLDHDIFFLF